MEADTGKQVHVPEWKKFYLMGQELMEEGDVVNAQQYLHRAMRLKPSLSEIRSAVQTCEQKVDELIEVGGWKTLKELIKSTSVLKLGNKSKEVVVYEADQRFLSWSNKGPPVIVNSSVSRAESVVDSSLSEITSSDDSDWDQHFHSAQDAASQELRRIQEDFVDGKYKTCKYRCQQILKRLKMTKSSEMSEDETQSFLGHVYSKYGDACLELGQFDEALRHYNKDREIGETNGFVEPVARALLNIGRIYIRRKQYRHLLDVWKDSESICTSNQQMTWVLHEMARAHLELGNQGTALTLAQRACTYACTYADSANNQSLLLQAIVLEAEIHELLSDYGHALQKYKEAHQLCLDIGDMATESSVAASIKRLEDLLQCSAVVTEEVAPENTGKWDDLYSLVMQYILKTIPDI